MFEESVESDMEDDVNVNIGSVRIVRLLKQEQEPLVC